MHHDRIVRAHAFENFQRPPALDHKVLRDDLEPVHRRMLFEDVYVMRTTEPHTEAQRLQNPSDSSLHG